jgi:hypothetical protein
VEPVLGSEFYNVHNVSPYSQQIELSIQRQLGNAAVMSASYVGTIKVGYFEALMATNEDIHDSIRPVLKLSREMICRAQKVDNALTRSLERDSLRTFFCPCRISVPVLRWRCHWPSRQLEQRRCHLSCASPR